MPRHHGNTSQWFTLLTVLLAAAGYVAFVTSSLARDGSFLSLNTQSLIEIGVASILYIIFVCFAVFTAIREQTRVTQHTNSSSMRSDHPSESERIDHLQKKITHLQHELSIAQEQALSQGETKKALLNVMEDLSEQNHRIEVEKRKDEAILANIGEGIIVTDPNGQIMTVNTAMTALLGFGSEELLHRSFLDVIQVEDLRGNHIFKEKNPLHLTLAAKKGSVVGDYVFLHKNGTKMFVAVTTTPVILNNQIIGTVTAVRDVTKEKEVDRMKTEFISLVSHQLKTPLSAIKWTSEMLDSGDVGTLSTEQKDFIRNINQSVERMIQLINSLLNISRIESGRIIIDPSPTNLMQLVEQIQQELQPKLEEKKQTLIVNSQPGLPSINVDPKLTREVYLNLLTNAIKYSPNDSMITVEISQKENQIISQVTDKGYGIPKEQHNRVFQKFYRGDNIVKTVTDGTGLGLYLAKTIIDSSGGSIWFESEVGKGTTFWFSLPLSGMKAKKGEVSLA